NSRQRPRGRNLKTHQTVVKRTMPRTNPKQQSHLKRQFRAAKTGPKRKAVPMEHRVWRRTTVRLKPKPVTKMPRLFRVDRRTGLPLDYERTVERVMSYVNPHIIYRPSAEEMLEESLAKMFAELMRQGNRNQSGRLQLQTLLKDCRGCHCPMGQFLDKAEKSFQADPTERNRQETNDTLKHFHSACKRGPRNIRSVGPTYKSKFNFNQLRITST
ncbi:hypothetical protein KR018_007881, partial [Drosophila ironensis]